LWPGQYASGAQKQRGVVVPSSMRQVDLSADLEISRAYLQGDAVGVETGGENVQ